VAADRVTIRLRGSSFERVAPTGHSWPVARAKVLPSISASRSPSGEGCAPSQALLENGTEEGSKRVRAFSHQGFGSGVGTFINNLCIKMDNS
jgi:hypothetical protein